MGSSLPPGQLEADLIGQSSEKAAVLGRLEVAGRCRGRGVTSICLAHEAGERRCRLQFRSRGRRSSCRHWGPSNPEIQIAGRPPCSPATTKREPYATTVECCVSGSVTLSGPPPESADHERPSGEVQSTASDGQLTQARSEPTATYPLLVAATSSIRTSLPEPELKSYAPRFSHVWPSAED